MDARTLINGLDDEDMAFVCRFIKASGSLKSLAQEYGVSYPTIRIRLDRLIAKIEASEDAKGLSPFERTIRLLIADGKLDAGTGAQLLEAHRKTCDETKRN